MAHLHSEAQQDRPWARWSGSVAEVQGHTQVKSSSSIMQMQGSGLNRVKGMPLHRPVKDLYECTLPELLWPARVPLQLTRQPPAHNPSSHL